MQGDIVESCPVLVFKDIPDLEGAETAEEHAAKLITSIAVEMDRVIVMTQACDLEQRKVRNVILCPVFTAEMYHSDWKAEQERKGQKANSDAWRKFLNETKNGHIWNLALIQSRSEGKLQTPLLIVD